jgi:hypothetical protein
MADSQMRKDKIDGIFMVIGNGLIVVGKSLDNGRTLSEPRIMEMEGGKDGRIAISFSKIVGDPETAHVASGISCAITDDKIITHYMETITGLKLPSSSGIIQ